MNVPAAMARTLLQRHRIGLSVSVSYMMLITAALYVAKQENTPAYLAFLMISGLIVAAFYLLTVFVHADSDVATPGSTYPTHYFTLPVKTADLVVWPVLTGIVVLGSLTYLLCSAIKSAGYEVDPVGAAAFVVSLLTALQAIFWFPVGIAYSKLVLSVGAIAALIVLNLARPIFGISEAQRLGLFVGVTLCSFAITWLGVAKARSGGVAVGKLSKDIALPRFRAPSTPFKSPEQAQLWYEWRHQGKTLPILTIILFLLFLTPHFWDTTLSPIRALQNGQTGRTPTVPTYLLTFYPFVVVLMGLYGWAVGCGARRTDLKRTDGAFHLMFATRPLSDEALVWAKMKVAALSTAAAWVLLILASLPLLFVHGGQMTGSETIVGGKPLYWLFINSLTPAANLKVLCAILILVFLTWRNYAIGFWAELSGSLFLRYLQPLVSLVLYFVLTGNQASWHLRDDLSPLVYILAGLVALKLTLAVSLAVRQMRTRIVATKSLARVFAGYVAAVGIVGLAAFYLAASTWESVEQTAHQVQTLQISLILIVALYVPITRILLAVSTLSTNRHK